MRTYHIPIFVPHKGCPHDCVFCNQRHITGHDAEVTGDDVSGIIEEYLETMDSDAYIEAAFFGGSFTGIETDKQTELLSAAYSYVKDGRINGIRCSTRPDYIDKDILDNLKRFSVTCIELGVQTTDSEVLRKSRRGHNFGDVTKASQLIKSYGIELGLQMMLGLPGDSRDKMLRTAQDLIDLNPSCVRIYPTLVVDDTALKTMYTEGKYVPLGIEQTTDILSELIPMFERAGIDIIRVGLQTTDDINADTVEGPYHPAIRELAEGRIIRKLLEEHMSGGDIRVCVHPSRLSQVYGHKKCNREYFEDKYGIRILADIDCRMDTDKLKINDKIVAIY